MELTTQQKAYFQETLSNFYAHHARHDLPWRKPEADGNFDPYKVFVSELMLQQTQVQRVIPKYQEFLSAFPDAQSLAVSEQGNVLRAWQGLGYNRRAKFLWQAAQQVAMLGTFPTTLEGLVTLPGVGVNTAGAILAYAYNQPAVFIETNVRTVYIHHFFSGEIDIHDKTIRQLIEQTIDTENPRNFYWALMDYGSYLKTTVGNASKASKHYTKQSTFQGSRRQIRGQIIRLLGGRAHTSAELRVIIDDSRLPSVLDNLIEEGLIRKQASTYSL